MRHSAEQAPREGVSPCLQRIRHGIRAGVRRESAEDPPRSGGEGPTRQSTRLRIKGAPSDARVLNTQSRSRDTLRCGSRGDMDSPMRRPLRHLPASAVRTRIRTRIGTRVGTRIRSLFLLTLLLAPVKGCASHVPATVTMPAIAPVDGRLPIFLIATVQRAEILKSLRDAGLNAVEKPEEGGYTLDVRLGSRRSSRPCGSLRNVSYILKEAGMRIMIIKGRGVTGSCSPKFFDELSRMLASHGSR